jgi:hypothetical protein
MIELCLYTLQTHGYNRSSKDAGVVCLKLKWIKERPTWR